MLGGEGGRMNLEEVKKLTDEQLNHKVAELCGGVWKNCACGFESCEHQWRWHWPNHTITDEMPDYSCDLNAMHEAWELLSEEQRFRFTDKLVTIQSCLPDKDRFVVGATARQRAEAFTMTMMEAK
jgi:hypothetical protein